MALSDQQKAFRSRRLGSSDAPRLMEGRWREVWAIKTGRVESANLDLVPQVQIGIVTEPLHARFFSHKTGIGCYPAAKTYVHPEHDFLVANLDFLTWADPVIDPTVPADAVLEAKFSAGFQSDEELAEQYYWQVQHQMMVANLREAVLSILRPASYSFVRIPRDEAGIATLLATLKAFWWHVENDVEPEDHAPVVAPAFETMRIVDMSFHNEFMAAASVLAQHRTGVLASRTAEAALKALMPHDARIAFLPSSLGQGAEDGLFLTRSRDGRLSLRFGDVPKKHRDRAEPWSPSPRLEAAE